MMPKRVAETDPFTQITDSTGSGPFIFKRDEWRPGHLAVYVKNPDYKPRPEPASRLAGGKVAKVDRVEWHAMPDHLQAINALLAGEIDFIEAPPFDLHRLLKADQNVQLMTLSPVGSQNIFRLNHLHKPFDNPTVRRALWYAFNQEDFLKAVIGDPDKYKVCKALFICGTGLRPTRAWTGCSSSNFDKAKALLKEAGYDGTPVVLLQSSDLFWQTNLAPVAKRLMEKAGFKVDMQPMDWQSIIIRTSKKNPPDAGRLACLSDLARRPWTSSTRCRTATSIPPATRPSTAGPAIRRWKSCATALRARPSRPAEGDRRGRPGPRHRDGRPYVHLGEWRLVSAARKNVIRLHRGRSRRCSGTSKRSELRNSVIPSAAAHGRRSRGTSSCR